MKFFICLLALCCSLITTAQLNRPKNPPARAPRTILPFGTAELRHNVLGWMDPADQNFTLGAYVPLNRQKNFGVVLDVGYIFYNSMHRSSERTDHYGVSGFLIKPGIRALFGRYKRGFIDIQLLYKQVDYKTEGELPMYVTNGIPAYYMYTRYTERKTGIGITSTVGTRFGISSNQRLLGELYVGLGLRNRNWKITDVPGASPDYSSANWAFSARTDEASMPTLQGGFRLVLRLGKLFPKN
jgi:hypothetical protein